MQIVFNADNTEYGPNMEKEKNYFKMESNH